jgi:hypothetical protein
MRCFLYLHNFLGSVGKLRSSLIESKKKKITLSSLFVINRIGVTGRYPHNLEEVLEQYAKAKTQKIIS